MALSPTNDAALLQEVDEAVRKDRLDTIMQRYGLWIIGLAVAGLLAFGGYLYWDHQQNVARGESAEELVAALDKVASGQGDAATKALKAIEAGDEAAYRAAALIQQANMAAERDDLKGAAALMAKVAADPKLDSTLRDLALIRQTAFEFDTLKAEDVIARMKPIVDAKDPVSSFFPSAAELSAIAYYRMGQFDKAGALYGRIAEMPDLPRSLQSRSVQMAGMLGVDAVADDADETEKAGAAKAGAPDPKKAAGKEAAAAKTEEAK
ncbi:tetratricopeptide repeat protein [Sphingopyxis sp. MWB1]|uniref:tetratricopeptide repeat protein n=1 Tax=Sphingopyxis sp. MWB1 TaxID=1537715 RepID=UPI00051A19B6|nr:tetratricopeptide repeat protein [Sphingopyxis sp. MWB1]